MNLKTIAYYPVLRFKSTKPKEIRNICDHYFYKLNIMVSKQEGLINPKV